MVQIDDKIISLDIFEKKFICNLDKCLGACCVHGDSGAPLEKEEAILLEKHLAKIKPHLTVEGLRAISEQGVAVVDLDNDLVTTLIGTGGTCAYAYFNSQGVCLCGIEKAYRAQDIDFHKPVSCHLYPIRIKKIGSNIALNFDEWTICKPALTLGEQEQVPVFRFLKEPLERRFGTAFYQQLEVVAEMLENEK